MENDLLPTFWSMMKSEQDRVRDYFYRRLDSMDEILCQYLKPSNTFDWIFETFDRAIKENRVLQSVLDDQRYKEMASVWKELSPLEFQSLATALIRAFEDIQKRPLDQTLTTSWMRFFTARPGPL